MEMAAIALLFVMITCFADGIHGGRNESEDILARLDDFIPNCLLTCGIPNPPLPFTMQIPGRTETALNEFPWLGYFVDRKTGSFIGGGMLITDQYLLTSASLVTGLVASMTSFVLGDHDRSTQDEVPSFSVRVDRFIVHPNFTAPPAGATNFVSHDIAVVRLRSKVAFTRRVRPICLPWPSLAFVPQNSFFHQQQRVTVAGWATSNPAGPGLNRVLRATDLTVITQAGCQDQLGPIGLPDSVFCATPDQEDVSNCLGDVGGAAAWDPQTPILQVHIYFAIGVVLPRQRCGSLDPNVFTRVDKYLNFIRQNTNIQHCGTDLFKL